MPRTMRAATNRAHKADRGVKGGEKRNRHKAGSAGRCRDSRKADHASHGEVGTNEYAHLAHAHGRTLVADIRRFGLPAAQIAAAQMIASMRC